MKLINIFFVALLTLIISSTNLFAGTPSKDPKEILKTTLKNSQTSIVDYSSGCPSCVQAMISRPKVILESKDNNQKVELSLLSEKEVNNLFKDLSANPDIPFGYPFDGCYARAHAMAKMMEERGIICGKAFVEGNLFVDSQEFGEIQWRYHVAPVVMVKVNGKNVPYVLDPSIMDKPVPFETWRNKMIKKQGSYKSTEYFTNRFAYDPEDKVANLKEHVQEYVEDSETTNKNYRVALERYRFQKTGKN